jgi:hypothetical protein
MSVALVVALALSVSASAQPAASASQSPAAATSLKDIEFVAGHWTGGDGADLSEEVWTAPSGDSMLGMWRYVSQGKVRIAELLSITAESDGVWLRLRHFDPRVVAREEKDRPLALKLVKVASAEARFEGPAVTGSGQVALTYRRSGPDALEVSLERGGKTERFSFTRKRS